MQGKQLLALRDSAEGYEVEVRERERERGRKIVGSGREREEERQSALESGIDSGRL